MANELVYDWHLTTLTPWSMHIWFVYILLGLGLSGWLIWRERHTRLGGKILWLRVGLVLLTLALAMQPAVVWEQGHPISPRIGILLDTSASMALPFPHAASRLQSLTPLLERWQQEATQPPYTTELHWFDLDGPSHLHRTQHPPVGNHSDLLAGLEPMGQSHQNKPFAAVVILSDGADTTLDPTSSSKPLALSTYQQQRLQTTFAGTPPPISSIAIGQSQTIQDVAITHVQHDDFAFVRNTITLQVTLFAQDVNQASIMVQLFEQDGLLQQESITLQEGINQVQLQLRPEIVGEHLYRIHIPPLAGETILHNNSFTFPLQVIRDKIRILHVVGRPSWDERFLRQHLKENPNIDVVSFFILRTPNDDTSVPEQDLSLIPFPVERLFTTELRNFDLILLQNFDHRPYRMTQYLPSIQQAVEQGLGLVMLGGNESFGLGGYANSPIADILPFVPGPQDGFVQQAIQPCLTTTGQSHPITDVLWGRGDNDKAWRQLPGFLSYNPLRQVHPQANVLVRECGGNNHPLFAVRDVGKGRVLALATDSLWRWRFSERADAASSEQVYHRFWSNSFRWLIKDPTHARIKLQPERRQIPFGEPIRLTARMLNQQDMPLPGAQLHLTLHDPNQQEIHQVLTCNEQGVAQLTLAAPLLGTYRIVAEHRASQETAQTSCVVQTDPLEYQHLLTNVPWLTTLAKATGGRVWSKNTEQLSLSEIPTISQATMHIEQTTIEPLWHHPWPWILWLAMATWEWWLRRRWGGV